VAPPPEPALFTAADEEVMATFIAWLAVDGHDHLIVERRDEQRGRFSGRGPRRVGDTAVRLPRRSSAPWSFRTI
jgi:hypothetical protein